MSLSAVGSDGTMGHAMLDERRRSGVTLVELLIIFAIIGMLISLTIPAVRASREAARRTGCLNNSRQIGLAIHHYHDAKRELPPSRIRDRFLTWAALILPYLDEYSVGEHVDTYRTFAGQSEAVRLAPVPMFLCPSRHHRNLVVEDRGALGVKGDYAAVTSTFVLAGDYGRYFDGAMIVADAELSKDHGWLDSWKSRTSFRDVTDGLSKTFIVAEGTRWMVDHAPLYDGNLNTGAILGDDDYPDDYVALAKRIRSHPVAESEVQTRTCVGSAHPDVFVVTMADNSSRVVKKAADLKLLEHLVTRAGGEATSLADIGAY